MIKIAICDDEQAQCALLKRYVSLWGSSTGRPVQIHTFCSSEQFLFRWDEDKSFDLLVLDIEMGSMNGMELAKKLRREKADVGIVFVTGFEQYMSEGYEVEALHYLLKPVSAQKLSAVLDRALERLDARDKSLLVESDEGLCRLPLSEIRWLEVMGNYVTIHAGRDYTLRKPLKELVSLLDESFFRTGRSFLVNLRFVKEVTRTHVTLTDASTVPLSRRRYDAIHRAIISYY